MAKFFQARFRKTSDAGKLTTTYRLAKHATRNIDLKRKKRKKNTAFPAKDPDFQVFHRANLQHLTSSLPQHIRQPLRAANHETVPATLATLNYIKCTRSQSPSFVDNHLSSLQRKHRLVMVSNHVDRWIMAPSSVRLHAWIDSNALVREL